MVENPIRQFTLNYVAPPAKKLHSGFHKQEFLSKRAFRLRLRNIGKDVRRSGYLFEDPDKEAEISPPTEILSEVASSSSNSTTERFPDLPSVWAVSLEPSSSKSTNERFFEHIQQNYTDSDPEYLRPDYLESDSSSGRYCLRLREDRAERLRVHRAIERGGRPLKSLADIEALYNPDVSVNDDPDSVFAEYSDPSTRKPRGYSRRSRYEGRNYSEEDDPLYDRESGSDRFARKMVNFVFSEQSGQDQLSPSEYVYSPTQCRAEIQRLHRQNLLPAERNDLDWLCDNDMVLQVGYPKFCSDLASEFSALSSDQFWIHDLHTYLVSLLTKTFQ